MGAECQGQLLRTYSIPNLYAEHHFKIVVDSSTISVWDGDTLVIDNFVLPENDYGYGFWTYHKSGMARLLAEVILHIQEHNHGDNDWKQPFGYCRRI